MRRLLVTAVMLGSTPLANAQTGQIELRGGYTGHTTVAPGTSRFSDDPVARGRQIDEIIRQLQEAPGVKEIFDLQKKINRISTQAEEDKKPLYDRITRLQEGAAYKDYLAKLDALQRQRETQWEVDRRKLADAARQIYEARHAELAKRAPGDLPEARTLGFDVLTYPRVDGSTSTHPLAVILASRVLNVPYEWRYPEPTGYPWARPQMPGRELPVGAFDLSSYRGYEFDLAASRVFALGTTPRDQRIGIMINSLLAANSNTHDAYVHVIEGACDLNLTARAPSEDEAKLARDKRVELDLVPIATDALVFLVHRDNPVRTLTLDQLKSIYQLKTTQWPDLGWQDPREKTIRPLYREPNSGSRELFDTLLMKTPADAAFQRATANLYSSGMGGPYNDLTQHSHGIAYSVYYYEHFMALSPQTRALALNGIEPNAETLANGKYPLSSPVYAVVRKSDPADAPGRKLLRYLASPEGQTLLREAGYVPAKR